MPQSAAATAGAAFLNELLDRLNLTARVEAGPAKDDVQVFKLVGDAGDLALKPSLRSAIALLGSQAISRAAGDRHRCVLDIDGRLEARERLLETAAGAAAKVVERTDKRVVIDGLTAAERRIVHAALAEEQGVATRSEGDGDHRWLCIEKSS